MIKQSLILFVSIFLLCTTGSTQVNYLNESSADFNKRMQWFKDAKFGMFIHFGLYSQLGGVYKGKKYDGYAEWIQSTADIPSKEYATLTSTWNPENFDADKVARLAKEAGMKYIVITTKHHEGFCLWDSRFTDFDIANTPMKGRDIVNAIALACRKYGLRFGTYYSIIDFHHESQYPNAEGKSSWDRWGQLLIKPEKKQAYVTYMKNQLKELIKNYDTDMMWFDGDWVNWWNMQSGEDLYQYLRTLKPSIIINNRVAKREQFKRDFGTPEQEHPAAKLDHYWEACYTMNDSWGFKEHDNNWKTSDDILKKLTEINTKGGNLLLNIGPDGHGNIPQPSIDILKQVGEKLQKD